MHELVDLTAVQRWFTILALLLPLLGIGIGAALQLRARRPRALAVGFVVGLLGPLNWLLWHVYNAIEDQFGLDSVKAMLLNLALFAVLGLIAGQVFRCSGVQVFRSSKVNDGPAVDPNDPEPPNA